MFPIPFPGLEAVLLDKFEVIRFLTIAISLCLGAAGIMFVVSSGFPTETSHDAKDARLGFKLLFAALVTWAFGYYLVPVMILIVLLGVIIGFFTGTRRALGL